MRIHKRKIRTRKRGSKTQGYGFRQKHKGSGNKGGKGMAGSSAHKRQKAREMDPNKHYFGRRGLTSRPTAVKKYDKINLRDIKDNFSLGKKIDLSSYKILGEGEGFKAEIIAKAATESAIEKMEKAGGKIILPIKKEIEKKEIKVLEEKKDSKQPSKEEKVEKKKETKKTPAQNGSDKPTKKSARS